MALTRAKKKQKVQILAKELETSTTAIVGTFAKLTVSQDFELRKVVRGAGGQYRVLKNKLAAKASEGTKVEAALKGLLKPEFEEVRTGSAEVREIFRSSKFGNIAGCIVRSGEIRRNARARLLRGGVVINDNLQIDSLRRFKDDVTEVREGFECGIGLGTWNNIEIEDTIETFEVREKPRV